MKNKRIIKKKSVQKSISQKIIIDLDPFLNLQYKDFKYFDENELIHVANKAMQSGAQGVMLHLQKKDLKNRRLIRLYQEFIQVRPGQVVLFCEIETKVMKKVRQLKPDVALFYRQGRKQDPFLPLGAVKKNEKTLLEKIQSLGTQLSFFIQADPDQVAEAYYYGADSVMLDCAKINLLAEKSKNKLMRKMNESRQIAQALDLQFYLGRGLKIEQIDDLSADAVILGQSLLQKSILVGLSAILKNKV